MRTTHPTRRVNEGPVYTQGGNHGGNMPPPVYQPSTYPTDFWTEPVPQQWPAANLPPNPYVNAYTGMGQNGQYRTTSSAYSQGQMRSQDPFQQQDTTRMYPPTLIPSSAYQSQPLPQGYGSSQQRRSSPVCIDLRSPDGAGHRSVLGKRHNGRLEDADDDPNQGEVRPVKKVRVNSNQHMRAANPAPPRRVVRTQSNGCTQRQEIYNGASKSSYHGRADHSNPRTGRQNEVRPVQSRKRSYQHVDTSSYGEDIQTPVKRHRGVPAVRQTRRFENEAEVLDNQSARTSELRSTQSAAPRTYRSTPIQCQCHQAVRQGYQRVCMVLPVGTRLVTLRETDDFALTGMLVGDQQSMWRPIDRTHIDAALERTMEEAASGNIHGDTERPTNSLSARSPISPEDHSPSNQTSRGYETYLDQPNKAIGKNKRNPIAVLEDNTAGQSFGHNLPSNQAATRRSATRSRQPSRRFEGIVEQSQPGIQPYASSQGSQDIFQGSRSSGTMERGEASGQPVVEPSMTEHLAQSSVQEQMLPPQIGAHSRQQDPVTDGTTDPSLLSQTGSGFQQDDNGFASFFDSQQPATADSQPRVGNSELGTGLDWDDDRFADMLRNWNASAGQASLNGGLFADLPDVNLPQDYNIAPSDSFDGNVGSQRFDDPTSSVPVQNQPVQQAPQVGDELASQSEDGQQEAGDDLASLFEDRDQGAEAEDPPAHPSEDGEQGQEVEDPLAYLFEDEGDEPASADQSQ